MKYFLTTLAIFSISLSSFGQTVIEEIAQNACECIETSTISKADSCMTSSMAKVVMANNGSEKTKFVGTVEGMRQAIKDSYKMVQDNCESFRSQIITKRKEVYYKESDNKDANFHYKKGNQKLQNGAFKDASKDYKKAIKLDPNFVFALDNIAVCYRNMESFDKAAEYYNKSLDIFPEGNIALQNIAAVYGFMNDSKLAIKYYNTLISLYPNDPEGYFGVAKESLISGDLELASEYGLIAYILYKNSNSEHFADGEKLVTLIYNKLKEINQIDIFKQHAKELNIDIEIN
jgi:tetratricopeptide (TPR) repeat protein